MECALCLSRCNDERLIDIVGAESQRLHIASILHAHFRFCFWEEPVDGYVCQKCWVKVSVFHEFYSHVEYVHRSRESVFVESIADDVKFDVESESDKWGLESDNNDSIIPHNTDSTNSLQNVVLSNELVNDFLTPVASTGERSYTEFTLQTNSESEGLENDSQREAEWHLDSKIFKESGSDDDHFDDHFDTNFTDTPASKSAEKESGIKPKRKRGRPPKSQAEKDATPIREDTKRAKWLLTRRPNESGTFQCETCGLHFLTFMSRDRHIKEAHNAREFKCKEPKCVDSFSTQQLLNDHTAKHRRSECPHCKKMISDSYIARHIQVRHGATNVVCEQCGKVSLNETVHREHYRHVHECVVRPQCDICGQSYKNLQVLRIHMVTHVTGPMKCASCGHVAPHQRAWYRHMRGHRPGIKDRQKCDVCGKGFRDKRVLEEHYHIHTGTAGSYRCEDCGKIFRFSSSFSVHRKKVHPK